MLKRKADPLRSAFLCIFVGFFDFEYHSENSAQNFRTFHNYNLHKCLHHHFLSVKPKQKIATASMSITVLYGKMKEAISPAPKQEAIVPLQHRPFLRIKLAPPLQF